MSALPIENLEARASQQRERIHQTTLELMSKVSNVREQFSATNILHSNLGRASALASVLGLVFGYFFAGAFARRQRSSR